MTRMFANCKPQKRPPVHLAGLLVVLLATLLAADAVRLMPDKLHCLSTLYLTKKTVEQGLLVSYDKLTLEHYRVEEFLDLNSNRSSVLVHDATSDMAQIFYNQLSPKEYGSRHLISYDPLRKKCQAERIIDWQLAELRHVVMSMESDSSLLERRRVDVPIGPSGLLYALEDHLDDFHFRGTIFSKSRLTTVDVYRNVFDHHEPLMTRRIAVVVHVMTRDKDKLKVGEPLRKFFEKNVSKDMVGMNVALIGACKMDEGSTGEDSDGGAKADNLKLDEDDFCARESILFVAHFNLVTDYQPGTLIGRSLDDLTDGHYKFQREPFMMPTGIGCWNSLSGALNWQRSLTRNNFIEQLSGEFTTTYDSYDLSFVAYDRKRALLRLDRNGRKSVYDLAAAKSYHVDEFALEHKTKLGQGWKAMESRKNNRGSLEGCISLDVSSSSQVSPNADSIIYQLLGLRSGTGEEHHLGSRTIDHVSYEVFERELDPGAPVPVLLQVAKILLSGDESDVRVFITYYAQSLADFSTGPQNSSGSSDDDDDDDDDNNDQKMAGNQLVLRYIELWTFDLWKRRRLINRLEFSEFSWQLDVEPANDPTSQRAGSSLNTRLFTLEPCYEDRAAQAELVVEFKRQPQVNLNWELIRDLRRHEHLLTERVQRFMAETLEISPLNLVDTRLRVSPEGNLLTTSRLIELQRALLDRQSLGTTLYLPLTAQDKHFLGVVYNCHSLEECQLESASWLGANWFAYCKRLAACVFLEPSDELKAKLGEQIELPKTTTIADICQVYSFRYASLGAHRASRRVLKQAELNSHMLNLRTFEFNFNKKAKRAQGKLDYMAKPDVHELKQLDSIGDRLTNELALLTGMRYSTPREEPKAFNMNRRVVVPRQTRMGSFRFCQLACQMDDQCASYSVCLRKSSAALEDDCVLSAVRLTGERVNELIESSDRQRKEEKFEIKIRGESLSQILMMHHESGCSLHPKDFLAEYEVARTYARLGLDMGNSSSKSPDGSKEAPEKPPQRRLSMEDCASLNFELTRLSDPNSVSFTYCPLESLCIVTGDEAHKQVYKLDHYCVTYRHRLTHAYEVKRMMHLVLAPKVSQPNGSGASEIEKNELSRMESLVSKRLWISGEQECARECNLQQVRCLTFDICRRPGHAERQVSQQFKLSVETDMICDHYYLKADYFDVRLKHFLELDRLGQPNQNEDEEFEHVERDKLEQSIIDEDKQASERERLQIEQQVAELAKELELGQQERIKQANNWFHLSSLAAGLLLGALATLYRTELAHGVGASIHWAREEVQRRRQLRADQSNGLLLDNPFGV